MSATRKTILYAGGFGLPDRNASAIRCLGNAELWRSLGYDVVILGKLRPEPPAAPAETETTIDGFRCIDIRRPVWNKECRSYVKSVEPVAEVVASIGAEHILAIVAYNYPARGLAGVIQLCRREGLFPVLDCTEWYGWEGTRVLHNLMRITGTWVRGSLLTRWSGNVICASSYMAARLPGQNVLVLPFVVKASDAKWRNKSVLENPVPAQKRFIYSGSPGMGLSKDRLDYVIAGFHRIHQQGVDFRFLVAGLTQENYLQMRPGHRRALMEMGQKVTYTGRIPHLEALSLLKSADFSVFFRKSNRSTNVGFPTKYVEAASVGIPVITNATSDLDQYLEDGINGFMIATSDSECIHEAILSAATMDGDKLAHMKRKCGAENPFELSRWQESMRQFLGQLRAPR